MFLKYDKCSWKRVLFSQRILRRMWENNICNRSMHNICSTEGIIPLINKNKLDQIYGVDTRKRRSCSSDQIFRNVTEGETQLRCEIFVGEKPVTLQDQQFHSKHTAVTQADELHTINGFSVAVVSVSSRCYHICPSQLIAFTVFSWSIFMKYLATLPRTTRGM